MAIIIIVFHPYVTLGLPFFAYVNPLYKEYLQETFGKHIYYFLSNFLFGKPKLPNMYIEEKERMFGSTNQE